MPLRHLIALIINAHPTGEPTRQPDNETLSARSASDEKERMIIRPSFEIMTRFEYDSVRDIALFETLPHQEHDLREGGWSSDKKTRIVIIRTYPTACGKRAGLAALSSGGRRHPSDACASFGCPPARRRNQANPFFTM